MDLNSHDNPNPSQHFHHGTPPGRSDELPFLNPPTAARYQTPFNSSTPQLLHTLALVLWHGRDAHVVGHGGGPSAGGAILVHCLGVGDGPSPHRGSRSRRGSEGRGG